MARNSTRVENKARRDHEEFLEAHRKYVKKEKPPVRVVRPSGKHPGFWQQKSLPPRPATAKPWPGKG